MGKPKSNTTDRRGHNAAKPGSGEVGFQPRRAGKRAPAVTEVLVPKPAVVSVNPEEIDLDQVSENYQNAISSRPTTSQKKSRIKNSTLNKKAKRVNSTIITTQKGIDGDAASRTRIQSRFGDVDWAS